MEEVIVSQDDNPGMQKYYVQIDRRKDATEIGLASFEVQREKS
jgi:hypothetical protein